MLNTTDQSCLEPSPSRETKERKGDEMHDFVMAASYLFLSISTKRLYQAVEGAVAFSYSLQSRCTSGMTCRLRKHKKARSNQATDFRHVSARIRPCSPQIIRTVQDSDIVIECR